MSDDLPGINGSKQRIQITEDDLASTPNPAAPARPPRPSAPTPSPTVPGPTAPARPPRPPAPASAPAATGLPAVAPKASPTPPAERAIAPGGSYCSGCGSAIHPQAVVCPRCGVPTVSAAQATGAAMNVALNSKSTGLAILLSLVFTGAGHWYVGRVGRGFAFLAAAIISSILILAVVGFFLLPIVWAWAAIDANKCAQAHNQLLLAQAGTPGSPPVLNG
jgi:TM2 domain-containing membrane protein YozV